MNVGITACLLNINHKLLSSSDAAGLHLQCSEISSSIFRSRGIYLALANFIERHRLLGSRAMDAINA